MNGERESRRHKIETTIKGLYIDTRVAKELRRVRNRECGQRNRVISYEGERNRSRNVLHT